MMILLLTSLALAADEPCYGHTFDHRFESEHFWLELESEDGLTERQVDDMLDAAETARAHYIDTGWPFTEQPVVIAMHDSGSGLLGNAVVEFCPDIGNVPKIQLGIGDMSGRERGVTAHEVAHAATYGVGVSQTRAFAQWPWWLEGSAVWMALGAEPAYTSEWESLAGGWVETPGASVYAAHFTSQTGTYGTAAMVAHLEQYTGDPDMLRATWEYSATQPSERLYWPDVVEAVGLDWPDYQADLLAHVVTADLPEGHLLRPLLPSAEVSRLPDSGAVYDNERLGRASVRIHPGIGEQASRLDVVFRGDPEARWVAVVVQTDGERAGAQVLEYERLDIDETGLASAAISPIPGATLWIAASPDADDPGDWAWEWEVSSPDGPIRACGCDSGTPTPGWLGGLLLLAGIRRRTANQTT